MYIIEINGQYVQDISDGMPRFVFGKFGARQCSYARFTDRFFSAL